METFNPHKQSLSLDSKIIFALERLSEAFRVLLWRESANSGLSPIQMQILIFLKFHDEELRRLRYVANEFNMSRATVSDAVIVLEQKGLVRKIQELEDKRSYILNITDEGEITAQKCSGFASLFYKPLLEFKTAQKENMLNGLLGMIFKLTREGVINTQRMCYTCSHYNGNNEDIHYCKLLETNMPDKDLRIDCPEHKMN